MIRNVELEEQYKLKIIFIGDSGVGKTNIRQRFCINKFDPFSTKTIGVQFSTRRFTAPLGEKIPQRYVVNFWDIMGQINNLELIPSYFKNAIGVIYVFDLTNQQSLDNLKIWKEKVQDYNNAKTIDLLLGNKKELKHLRQVTKDYAQKIKNQLKISQYSEVSALQQNGGGIQQAIYEYLTTISNELNFGIKKPNKLKKAQQRHRSCI